MPVLFRQVILLVLLFIPVLIRAQSNVRVMAANLNGNTQSYQPFALRIFQGLASDVVAIQEFNYTSTNGLGVNTSAAFREMIDTAFGTNFVYYREPLSGGGDIPNGIISRYPIINSGSWTDTLVANRGFAWAQIDLPGTNDLYIVSVHFLTSSSGNRATEAANLKTLMQANFPANAWLVVAGDFNAGTRTEACVTTFNGYLTDSPIPVDNLGNPDTSANRNSAHDYVLPSLSFTNFETATVLPSHSFPDGLVFDSRVYTPLSDVPPVLQADSGNAQHMAVIKDFLIPGGTNSGTAPGISAQPQSQTISPGSNVTFSVTATGNAPFAYQWRFNNTNISSATTNTCSINNVQTTNAGNYVVVITNVYGSITSSIATLAVTNLPPSITSQPQNQSVTVGSPVTFNVTANGAAPLNYQWRFNDTNIASAVTNFYTLANAQLTNAGNYTVVITNISGSITSAVAALTVFTLPSGVIAQWNFNSLVGDATTSTGTRAASIGSGTNSYVGGAAANAGGEFAGGSSTDPNTTDNSAWNTSTYPASTANNKTAGVQFNVSTAGKQNIIVAWASQASGSGSKYGRLQYATNGTTFIDFPTSVLNPTTFSTKTNSLAAIPGINDNTNFAFRFVTEFEATATGAGASNYVASGTYGTGGTLRFDMVTVYGSTIASNTPASPAMLSSPGVFAGNQFQLTVTGSADSNYVIQVSTNLSSTNWLSIFTNASPFTFTESNADSFSQRFYRAVAAP
jgi:endonuclease/exonuclease/phosphatase family metal-dependent hydrolase